MPTSCKTRSSHWLLDLEPTSSACWLARDRLISSEPMRLSSAFRLLAPRERAKTVKISQRSILGDGRARLASSGPVTPGL